MFGGFGGDMFGGEDVNAQEMGGGGGGGQGSGGGSMGTDYQGLYPQGTSQYGSNEDPAFQATQDASFSADKLTNESYEQQSLSTSAGIGKTAGLFSAIEGLVGPRQKRLRKSQRVYSRAMAQAAVDNAGRALAQYKEDSALQEQKLSQSYAGRGVGESSIFNEGMQYFHDTQSRKMEELTQNIALANIGQRVTRSQISASYASTWTSFGNSVAALV